MPLQVISCLSGSVHGSKTLKTLVAMVQARNYLHTAVMQIQPDIVEYLLSIGVEATQTALVGNMYRE